METVAFCEIEPFCQKVLKKHWPDVPIYEDIHDVSRKRLDADGIGRIDVITGGFPCQDISVAGKRAGIEGDRSGLWAELCRIIGEVRPQYAIMENVTALISGDRGRWFGRVLGDLAEIGYDCEWHCIPASELGAHHHRDRVWIIAYPGATIGANARALSSAETKSTLLQQENGQALPSYARPLCSNVAYPNGESEYSGLDGGGRPGTGKASPAGALHTGDQGSPIAMAGPDQQRPQGWLGRNLQECTLYGYWQTEPGVGRVANGVSRRVDRLKGLGNAVVPQIPEIIGQAIIKYEAQKV